MLFGFLHDEIKFIYDLPEEINDIHKLYHLSTGPNYTEGQRSELFGLPKLRGFNGPMYNGTRFSRNRRKSCCYPVRETCKN